MLHIGYFVHSNISTSETFIYDLIKGLSEQADVELTFVSGAREKMQTDLTIPCLATGFAEKFTKSSYRIRKLGQIKGGKGDIWKMNFNQWMAIRQLGKSYLPHFDVAYVEYATTGVLVMNYLEKRNIPFVVHVHGYDITSMTNDKAYLEKLKILFKKADALIAASQYMKRRLILLGCDEQKIKVIHLGVDSSKIKPHLWSERIKLNPSIIFLGRLTAKKHPVALLYAFKIVLKAIPNATLTIIGDGPMKNEVNNEIKRLKLTGKVKMPGVLPREQSFPIMNQHWIYAQHSVTGMNGDTEGFAISLAEAALHELPVVSTIHNGITENVIDGQTGFLVPEHDYEAMAEKIIYLIQNPDLAEQMGKAGREHIMQLCVPRARIEEIAALLKEASIK